MDLVDVWLVCFTESNNILNILNTLIKYWRGGVNLRWENLQNISMKLNDSGSKMPI